MCNIKKYKIKKEINTLLNGGVIISNHVKTKEEIKEIYKFLNKRG